ncbi:hypothetical protein HDU91_002971, partial [Kappamyces sp. JEL0680]
MNAPQWIQRQSTDKFVQLKSKFNYRSRSAFKLYEIQKKHRVIRPGNTVLDLGASPGGWSQVALQHIAGKRGGRVIAVDIMAMDDLEGVTIIE